MIYESRFAIGDSAMMEQGKVIIFAVTFTVSQVLYQVMNIKGQMMYNVESDWLTPLEKQEVPRSDTE